jgi:hypothetical protein
MFRFLKVLFPPEDEKETRERIFELEKQFRRLEEEWTEVYHKFRVLQMRVAKQVQRLDQTPEGETAQPAGGEPGALLSEQSGLTPGQAAWQRKIMARRNRRPNGGT